jgi:hypothetical protein
MENTDKINFNKLVQNIQIIIKVIITLILKKLFKWIKKCIV